MDQSANCVIVVLQIGTREELENWWRKCNLWAFDIGTVGTGLEDLLLSWGFHTVFYTDTQSGAKRKKKHWMRSISLLKLILRIHGSNLPLKFRLVVLVWWSNTSITLFECHSMSDYVVEHVYSLISILANMNKMALCKY